MANETTPQQVEPCEARPRETDYAFAYEPDRTRGIAALLDGTPVALREREDLLDQLCWLLHSGGVCGGAAAYPSTGPSNYGEALAVGDDALVAFRRRFPRRTEPSPGWGATPPEERPLGDAAAVAAVVNGVPDPRIAECPICAAPVDIWCMFGGNMTPGMVHVERLSAAHVKALG